MENYPPWKIYKEINPKDPLYNDYVKMLLLVEKDPGFHTSEGLAVHDNFNKKCLLVSLIYDYGLVDQYYRLTEKGKEILAQLKNA